MEHRSLSPLIPAASARPADDPIFALNREARRRLAEGHPVINATLGALLEDDGRLAVMPSVIEALDRVAPAVAAAYAPIAGDPEFLSAVIRDAVGDTLASRAVACATPGGSGALHHAICNFAERGGSVLTTEHYWSPYATMCEQAERRLVTFPTFGSDGRLHMDAMRDALRVAQADDGRALLILNAPCHNPTGYSLDDAEWRDLVEVVRETSRRGPFTLALDFAYARFGPDSPERLHRVVEELARHALVLLCWSASKSFAQYGARVGAAVAVCEDDALRRSIGDALAFSSRGTWSNCNHRGLLAVAELLRDDDLRRRSDQDRERLRALLMARVAAWNQAATAAGLRYPRYDGGFFVTVFVDGDPETAAAELRRRDVFVVRVTGALRVGICAVAEADIARLVANLGEALAMA